MFTTIKLFNHTLKFIDQQISLNSCTRNMEDWVTTLFPTLYQSNTFNFKPDYDLQW